jgi:hypothetical protein
MDRVFNLDSDDGKEFLHLFCESREFVRKNQKRLDAAFASNEAESLKRQNCSKRAQEVYSESNIRISDKSSSKDKGSVPKRSQGSVLSRHEDAGSDESDPEECEGSHASNSDSETEFASEEEIEASISDQDQSDLAGDHDCPEDISPETDSMRDPRDDAAGQESNSNELRPHACDNEQDGPDHGAEGMKDSEDSDKSDLDSDFNESDCDIPLNQYPHFNKGGSSASTSPAADSTQGPLDVSKLSFDGLSNLHLSCVLWAGWAGCRCDLQSIRVQRKP